MRPCIQSTLWLKSVRSTAEGRDVTFSAAGVSQPRTGTTANHSIWMSRRLSGGGTRPPCGRLDGGGDRAGPSRLLAFGKRAGDVEQDLAQIGNQAAQHVRA